MPPPKDQHIYLEINMLGVCQRPPQGDLGSFQAISAGGSPLPGVGDPNYGYVINPNVWSGSYGCPSTTTLVTSLPPAYYQGGEECQYPQGGVETKDPVLCPIGYQPTNPPGCQYPWIPAGCAALSPSVNISENESPVMCSSSWILQSSTSNKMAGCSGSSFSSAQVLPDACPANSSWCPSFMVGECSPEEWPNNPACDLYATSARGVPSSTPGLDASANLISNALKQWLASGGKPTDDNPFASKVIKWCGQYPGVCDSMLSQACSGYTSSDLDPSNYAGRTYDPHGTNALQMCGCFLPSSQYVKSLPTQCNATCAFPGAIPLSSAGPSVQGAPAQCSTTECAIDEVVVDYVSSGASTVTLSQVCGKPNNNACYFNGISANDPQDPNLRFQISTTCSTCFDYNPVTYQATQVTCPSSVGLKTSKGTTGLVGFISRWKWWILALSLAAGLGYMVLRR